MDKVKAVKIKNLQRRVARNRLKIESMKKDLCRCSNESDSVCLHADVAVLNAETIDLETELCILREGR